MKKHKRKLSNTKGDFIKNEKLCEGYVIDDRKRIVGEARRYDTYSRNGEIMLYDIDAFGFVTGYIPKDWAVMSKVDLLNDKKLRKELEGVEYNDWKKHNIPELKERWDNYGAKYHGNFEEFCRKLYKNAS